MEECQRLGEETPPVVACTLGSLMAVGADVGAEDGATTLKLRMIG